MHPEAETAPTRQAAADHRRGLAITAIGGLALTFDIPLIRLADGDAWSILLLRCAATFVAALVLWALWRRFGRNAPVLVAGRDGLIVAALYGLASITFILAVHNTSTANLVFILVFNSMFAALLSWLFLHERPRAVTLAAMPLMALGVLVIVGDGLRSGRVFGDAMALSSTVLLAAAITWSRASRRDLGFAALIGVTLPMLVAAAMVGLNGFRVAEPGWILFNGAVVTPVAFYCLASGPRFLSAPEVAMFYLLETVLAPVWVWLIFAEAPTRNSLIGGAILISTLVAHSVLLMILPRRRG